MEWPIDPLQDAVSNRSIYVGHVCIVPGITQVICQASSNELSEIIDPWIENTENQNEHIDIVLFLGIFALVGSDNINIECNHIDYVHHKSKGVEPSAIHFPLVLYQLLDATCFEYADLFSFLEQADERHFFVLT